MRGLSALLVVALLSSPAVAQPREQAGTGESALPGLGRVGAAGEVERGLVLAAAAGYGFTEDVLDEEDSHHRALVSARASYRPTPVLALGAGFGGRYDRHRSAVAGADDGWILEPRVLARAGGAIASGISVGADLELFFPSLAAASADARGLLTVAPGAGAVAAHLNAGFRFDRSARSVDDPDSLSRADRLAINASDSHAVLLGAGAEWRGRGFSLFGEWTWDLLVGAGAPDDRLRSPMRVGGGVRMPAGDGYLATVRIEGRLGKVAFVAMGEPLIPVDPLVSVVFVIARSPSSRPGPLVVGDDEGGESEVLVGVLRGRVTDTDGAPIRRATVVVGGRQAETDADGAFAVTGIPAGTLEVAVVAESYRAQTFTVEILAGAEITREVLLEGGTLDGQVRGVVLSMAGEPVAAMVRVQPGDVTAPVETDGSFELDLPPGEYVLVIDADGFAGQKRPIVVEEGGVTIVNVDLQRRKR